jgi:hypothetical protein
MRNLTKALAVLIALTMLMGTVVFAGFSDVANDSAFAEAIEVGVALGLYQGYEDGTFKPEGDITRAEFAAIVVRSKGQEAQVAGASGATKFVDVPADHWASGYINLATSQGIIAGYGDGNFGPEDNVTYEQAVKMLVEALGYGPAVGSAGYPVGYLTIANQRGMTLGVNGKNGVAINRGQVAQLVFNSLDVPLMEQSGFGNYIEYIIQDGISRDSAYKKTLLSEYFGVAKVRAYVQSNLGIDGIKKVGLARITVQRDYSSKFATEAYDEEFKAGKTPTVDAGNSDILSLVGATVVAYIQVDETGDTDHKVLYAKRYVSTSETVELIIDEIDDIVDRDDYYEVAYYETPNSARTTKITVADGAFVYVNGNHVGELGDEVGYSDLLNGTYYGTISFSLENDASAVNADFDTIFINDYKIMIVEEVNAAAGRVTGAGQIARIVFNPEDTEWSSRLVDKDGNELEWTSLKENDILAVQEVRGSSLRLVTATLIEDTVTGTVNMIDEGQDESETEYGIGGGSYKINVDVFEDDLELGDEGVFYLDILGRIVNFTIEDTAARNYAYVIAVAPPYPDSLDNTAQIRFYTSQGEIVTFDTATRFTVVDENGDTELIDAKEIDDEIESGEVVTFTLNSSGRINRITKARTDAGTTGFRLYAEGTNATYNYRSESFVIRDGDSSRRVYVDSNTVIMKVGEVVDGSYSDDDFELVSLAVASDDIELDEIVNIYAFDVNRSSVAKAIVIVGDFDVVSDETGIAMLIRTSVTSAANGERRGVATVFQDANKNDFASIDLVTSSDFDGDISTMLSEADLFAVKLNGAGEIKNGGVIQVATITDGNAVLLEESGGRDVNYYMYTVNSRTGSRIEATNEGTDREDVIVIPSKANVYVYNSVGNTAARRVLAPEDRYNVFYSERDGSLYDDNNVELDNVQMFVREYDGEIMDVVFYLWY